MFAASRRLRTFLTSGLLFALPATAHAHGAIPGLEGFLSGVVHPLTIPAHLLVIAALGLLAGQQSPQRLKPPLMALMTALGAALLLTLIRPFGEVPAWIPVSLALCVAALVAWAKRLPMVVTQILFALGAVVIGLDSAPEDVPLATALKSLVGTWLIVTFLVFDVAYYSGFATRRQWSQVAVRVLASWIVAIAVLMLAFHFRKPSAPRQAKGVQQSFVAVIK